MTSWSPDHIHCLWSKQYDWQAFLKFCMWSSGLTFQLPWVTKSEFLLTISIQYQAMRIKKKYQLGDELLIQYQILKTNIIRIVWQIERRLLIRSCYKMAKNSTKENESNFYHWQITLEKESHLLKMFASL